MQVANYSLTFAENYNDVTWSTDSKKLETTSGQIKEIIQPDKFEIETQYSVTVTITTTLGNVSSNASFSEYIDKE